MKWDTFTAAVSVLASRDDFVTLGGGEPTLWPYLIKGVEHALASYRHLNVHIVTNGSMTKKVWELVEVQDLYGDRLIINLSLDQYHDVGMVDPEVEEMFRSRKYSVYDNGDRSLVNIGRASHLYERGLHPDWQTGSDGVVGSKGCSADTISVRFNGDIAMCQCDDSPSLGSVLYHGADQAVDFYYEIMQDIRGLKCHRSPEVQEALSAIRNGPAD